MLELEKQAAEDDACAVHSGVVGMCDLRPFSSGVLSWCPGSPMWGRGASQPECRMLQVCPPACPVWMCRRSSRGGEHCRAAVTLRVIERVSLRFVPLVVSPSFVVPRLVPSLMLWWWGCGGTHLGSGAQDVVDVRTVVRGPLRPML